jgi:DNA-binding winged helix-turn-helix (wHTH) protein/Flp pilus assembly protein TadD
MLATGLPASQGAPPAVARRDMAEFTFGPYSLSTDTSRLTRDGAEVRLRPRAFHALRVLLAHVGAVVDYETIIAEGWEGVHVSRHTVDVTLAEVRRRLGEYGRWIEHRGKYGYALQVPLSDELVRQGWHFWSQRTRAGCERAIECFTRVTADCSSNFRAFEGLSASYLALAVFGMRCPLTMYPRFLDAHKRAVALTGLRPELRCDRAFGLHVFEHRPCEAEAEFSRTLSQKPTLPSAYVRLGLLYGATGRFDEALDTVARGLRVDPLLGTLAAAEVLVQCWRRDFATAVLVGHRATELHPHLQTVRVNYAQALQVAGRLEEALAQYQIASIIAPDVLWLRALEGACLAALGRRDEAQTILVGLEARRHSEYVDAYHMALLRAALRRPREAVAEIERAHAENSAWLYALDVDPMFDALRAEPGFRRLVRRSRAS